MVDKTDHIIQMNLNILDTMNLQPVFNNLLLRRLFIEFDKWPQKVVHQITLYHSNV